MPQGKWLPICLGWNTICNVRCCFFIGILNEKSQINLWKRKTTDMHSFTIFFLSAWSLFAMNSSYMYCIPRTGGQLIQKVIFYTIGWEPHKDINIWISPYHVSFGENDNYNRLSKPFCNFPLFEVFSNSLDCIGLLIC